MSKPAFDSICCLLDKTMDEAKSILLAIPRRARSETDCSPVSSTSTLDQEAEDAAEIKTKVYRTTSSKRLVLATFLDFKKPISDKTMKKLDRIRPSQSSDSAGSQ